LVAAGPPGWVAAGVAAAPGCGGLLQHHGLPGVLGCVYLEAAQGDDLLLRPNLEGEGMGSLAEDVLGAVIVRVEWGDDASTPEPDKEGAGEIS
jgi:hypothetical protein